MQNRRVVLLSNHSFLCASIQSLLQSEANLQFYTLTADEPNKISAKIKRKNPHVIIVDSGDKSLVYVSYLLSQHPKARVITLNFNQKGFNVYEVFRVVKPDLNRLMDTIRGRRRLPGKEFRQNKTKRADALRGGKEIYT